MLRLGVDIGAEFTKAAVTDDTKVLALAMAQTGFDQRASAEDAMKLALEKAGLKRENVSHIGATGMGRKIMADVAKRDVNEYLAAAKGAYFFLPTAKLVIDGGAEQGRAVKLDSEGKVKDFVPNEKCAAGAGAFVEAMARALEVTVDELAQLSLKADSKISINAQCVIFAESEVVSMVHEGTSKANISRAIHDAIAERLGALARRVGLEADIVLIGGMGKNPGFVESLKRTLEMNVLVPSNPEYVSAIGAALSD